MILVGGSDQQVADWAGTVLGTKFVQPLSAFGVCANDGLLKGAAIFNDHQERGNIELSIVGPGTLTASIIRGLAHYAFGACGASRVTCKTRKDNLMTRRILGKKRHGFVFEGVMRRYYGPKKSDDALIYVLYRGEAEKWLRLKFAGGQN